MSRIRKLCLSLLIGMSCLLPAVPGFAKGLVASGDVSVADGVKTYTYTFTFTGFTFNGLPVPNAEVTDIWVFMPESSRMAVFDATCSNPNWYTYSEFSANGLANLGMTGGELAEGDSITMWLKTASNVPTLYESQEGNTVNWIYYSDHSFLPGDSLLPFPSSVPEPSSILALFSGLAGVSGLVVRRRRR